MTTIKGIINTAHYATELRSESGNMLIADEPVASGGKGEGFNPGELLNAALAACTTMTLRMYADRKQWPLTSAEVTIISDHDKDVTDSTFQCEITLHGDLTDEQKNRLMEIATHCPIHRMMTTGVKINTTIK